MRMLQTVEAKVDTDGRVHLLEPLRVSKTSRALVVLLDSENGLSSQKGDATEVLKFLRENRLPGSARPSAEAIEAQITEARESWD
jgi:hypothetical protein